MTNERMLSTEDRQNVSEPDLTEAGRGQKYPYVVQRSMISDLRVYNTVQTNSTRQK